MVGQLLRGFGAEEEGRIGYAPAFARAGGKHRNRKGLTRPAKNFTVHDKEGRLAMD